MSFPFERDPFIWHLFISVSDNPHLNPEGEKSLVCVSNRQENLVNNGEI